MSEHLLPLKRSEVASYWLRSKIAAQYALRGSGKALQRISIQTGELKPTPPRTKQAADWFARLATRSMLRHQAEYEQEMALFNCAEDPTSLQLSLQDEVKARILARRALRGNDDATFFKRAVVGKERKRDKRRAEKAVATALGTNSVLPSEWGFYESGPLNPKEMASEITAFSSELLSQDLRGIPDAYLARVKELVPLRAGQFVSKPSFSKYFTAGEQVGTVRNLFLTDGRAHADAILAYQYASIARSEVVKGGLRRVEPNDSLPPIENFIIGIGCVKGSNEPKPLGLLSLTQQSLELLDFTDGLARLSGGILPPSAVSATSRIYDLVRSDFHREQANSG